MYFENMKKEVVEIITKQLKSQKIFLIGDNMTGKTEICNMVKNQDNSIDIFDNFNDKYSNLPNDRRILVVTHNRLVLQNANPYDKIIMLRKNSIYCILDVESSNDVDNYFYTLTLENNLKLLLSSLLNNAIQGIWSDLNEYYLNLYKEKKKELKNSDLLIIQTIEDFKKDCIHLNIV